MFRRCVIGKMRGEGPTNILPHTIVGQVNAAIAVNIITAISVLVEKVQKLNGIIVMVMAITAVANINAHIHQAESSLNDLLVDT